MKQNPLEEFQKIRLDEKEFNLCRKLADKIRGMKSATDNDRKAVLDYLEKECKKKHKVSYKKIETEEDYVVYEFKLNDKPCYVAFDAKGKMPPNLIPSGVINPDVPPGGADNFGASQPPTN